MLCQGRFYRIECARGLDAEFRESMFVYASYVRHRDPKITLFTSFESVDGDKLNAMFHGDCFNTISAWTIALQFYKPDLESDASHRIASLHMIEVDTAELADVPWDVALFRVRIVGDVGAPHVVSARSNRVIAAVRTDAKRLKETMAACFAKLPPPQDIIYHKPHTTTHA